MLQRAEREAPPLYTARLRRSGKIEIVHSDWRVEYAEPIDTDATLWILADDDPASVIEHAIRLRLFAYRNADGQRRVMFCGRWLDPVSFRLQIELDGQSDLGQHAIEVREQSDYSGMTRSLFLVATHEQTWRYVNGRFGGRTYAVVSVEEGTL